MCHKTRTDEVQFDFNLDTEYTIQHFFLFSFSLILLSHQFPKFHLAIVGKHSSECLTIFPFCRRKFYRALLPLYPFLMLLKTTTHYLKFESSREETGQQSEGERRWFDDNFSTFVERVVSFLIDFDCLYSSYFRSLLYTSKRT